MKILFVNNTENLDNIGCKSTSYGIKILLSNHEVKNIYAEQIFQLNNKFLNHYISKLYYKYINLLSYRINKYIKIRLIKNKNIIKLIEESDLILINGEGSIHDNRITSITLLCIAQIAKNLDKKVHLINCTIKNMNDCYLNIIRNLDKVVVRESLTKKYLEKNNINCILGADAAWVLLKDSISKSARKRNIKSNRILLTGGVINNINQIKDIILKFQGRYNIHYLYIDKVDNLFIDLLASHNIKSINAKDIFLKNKNSFFKLLCNYSFIISGRHHINIFAYYLGIPIIPLKSNTYKIEGTIKTLSQEGKGIKNLDDLHKIIIERNAVKKAINLSRRNFIV